MYLKDLFNHWEKFEDEEFIIIDKKYTKSYHKYEEVEPLFNRKIDYFYISDNKINIRII